MKFLHENKQANAMPGGSVEEVAQYLSREFAKTVADMWTGSLETALQRFELMS